ncbi:MAG: trypsin-like peptidase domain-containing protein [Clostridia bacterium]|jgi:serine protease Do|nr:trypsin-like peptidase domain-containing protein [Clostridia bacterium]MDH7572459.1 trypsin-like peptidase domain-containing protein [Clostridia bacterium]
MDNFRSAFPRRRTALLSYLVIALVAAVAGAVFALALTPYLGPALLGRAPTGENSPSTRDDTSGYEPVALPNSALQSPAVTIAERVGPTVVGVTNLKGYDLYRRPVVVSGSGTVIDGQKGYIVTNYHVVEGFRGLLITVDGGREYEARLVGGDPQTDLAVLQARAPGLRSATLGDSGRLRVGEMVAAVGNPLGRQFARSVTVGVVSALDRDISVESRPGEEITLRVIQTDAAINPGNSGGPLVNARGEVIGITSVKIAAPAVEGMGFAIPINDARPVIGRLIRDGKVRRVSLGLSCTAVSSGVAKWYDLERGLMIKGVLPEGPADRAGLRPGDVIVSVEGRPVWRPGDLEEVLAAKEAGQRIRVRVARGGRQEEVTLEVSEVETGAGGATRQGRPGIY